MLMIWRLSFFSFLKFDRKKTVRKWLIIGAAKVFYPLVPRTIRIISLIFAGS